MPKMRELSRWIRDYGHEARQKPRLFADRFIWHQLWTAMDVIDDVESAMTAYLQNEFPSDIGEKYLRVYGALQGLFIQQDALFDLIRAIHPTKEIRVNDVLKDVRDARNASVGHPTQLKRQDVLSAHGIVQHSICKDGFELLSYSAKDGSVFQYIPVRELIEKQRTETTRILSEVVEDLREKEASHRAQFRETKLMAVFNQVGYAFEKIFEEIRGNSPKLLGSWAVEHLQKSLDNFDELLHQRGLGIESYDSIKYLYSEIEHPLAELTKFVKKQPSEVLSNDSARVFSEALQSYFDELIQIATEIDQEYESAPDPIVQPQNPHIHHGPEIDAKFAGMSEDAEHREQASQIVKEFSSSDWETLGGAEKGPEKS
jgi:hypothetical protein